MLLGEDEMPLPRRVPVQEDDKVREVPVQVSDDEWTCAYCKDHIFPGTDDAWVGMKTMRHCHASPDMAHHLIWLDFREGG